MIDYYSAISTVMWIALIVLCVLVHENDRLSSKTKTRYYITYLLIFIAAMSEWMGIKLSGNPDVSSWAVRIVKCCDYIFTPIAGAAFAGQMSIKNNWIKVLNSIIGFNLIFQIVSLFTDWMIVLDENNVYYHGRAYTIYIAEYLLIVGIVILQFIIYGKSFRKQNRFSLYLIMFLVLLGIFMQELFGDPIRTAYIALTLGALMMYIHSTEFSQQKADDNILEQQIKIKTDALTGLMSRHAYSQALVNYRSKMPEDFVAFSIDINGLKTTNDSLGHEAGDELICGAARCIEQVFEKEGTCYRTGGDEFIVLAVMSKDRAEKAVQELESVTSNWHGKLVDSLSVSIGYERLADHKDATCEELVHFSDLHMYKAKDEYYKRTGLARRIT